MSIDISNELNSIKTNISSNVLTNTKESTNIKEESTNTKEESTNTDKQWTNATKIIEKNICDFESFLSNKVINIYQRPFNKLESKLKKRKIKEFLDNELKSNSIKEDKYKSLMHKYERNIDYNIKFKVEYSIENCIITKLSID